MKVKFTALSGVLSGVMEVFHDQTIPYIVFPFLSPLKRPYKAGSGIKCTHLVFERTGVDGEYDVYEFSGGLGSGRTYNRINLCANYIVEIYRNKLDPFDVVANGQMYYDIPGLTKDDFMEARQLAAPRIMK